MGEYADLEIERMWYEPRSLFYSGSRVARPTDYSEWRCKDGRVIKLSEMDEQHMRNTMNMLIRKGKPSGYIGAFAAEIERRRQK